MGLFGKKKRMIDIRELQKRGRMRLPVPQGESSGDVVTNDDGFVEMNGSGSVSVPETTTTASSSTGSSSGSSGGDFFNFMDNPASSSSSMSSSSLPSQTTPSEDLRKISQQLSDLDNKIYKMEQRIELLERKAGIGEL
tara:strand:+ start:3069 stop:3482 length:414 start_codon:yes stop_codon:yes gene_type:complete